MVKSFDESKCKYIINACAEILDMKAARPLTKLIYPCEWPEERGVEYDGVLGVDFSVHYGPQNTENIFDKDIANGKPETVVYESLLKALTSIADEVEKLVPGATVMVGEFTDIIGHEIHVFVPYNGSNASKVAETREVLKAFDFDKNVETAYDRAKKYL